MTWLHSASLTLLFATLVLVLVFGYLYKSERRDFLGWWALAWVSQAGRLGFEAAQMLFPASDMLRVGVLLGSLYCGFFILRGAFPFSGKQWWSGWTWIAAFCAVIIAVGTAVGMSQMLLASVSFGFSAVAFVWAGVLILRETRGEFAGVVTGVSLLLWGLHKADYPVLRFVNWTAPWGYYLAACFSLLVAVGMLMVYIARMRLGLRSAADRLSVLINQASDAIVVADTEGSILEINERGMKLLGLANRNIAGLTLSSLFAPEDLEYLPSILEQLRAGRRIIQERLFIEQDGTRLPVEISASMLSDGRLQMFVRDIRKRKRAEAALRDSEARFRAFTQNAPVGVLLFDRERRFRMVNPAFLKLVGTDFRTEDLAGQKLTAAGIAGLEKLDAGVEDVFRQGRAILNREIRPRAPMSGGNSGCWLVSIFPVTEGSGVVRAVGCVMVDVTERKLLEEQVFRVQRMDTVGTLAGGVAHDLNNLLAPVLLGIGYLRGQPLPADCADCLRLMESSVTKGSDLVKQLLSFVRGGQISFRQVELSGVVREIIGLVRQTFPKDMSVMFSGGDQPVEVMGDQTQLHQVLLNLFVNARDAMEGRGRIDVEITHQVVESGASDDLLPEGDYVMVSVSDTGPGVSPAVIGRIFEPFFTTKESGTGTGIGLSTCRTIVRAHGGSLYVENRPGRGATFRMLLPVVGRAGPVATAIPEAALGSGQLILVVDNEVSILGAIEETLSVHGYRVLTAANSEDALKLYRRYGDDLAAVVAESNLGENPGRSVLDVLADLNPNLPIIDLGGASGEGTPVGLPLRRRLRKPFTPGELLAAVDAVLDVA